MQQKAMELVTAVYPEMHKWSREEQFGHLSQIWRAAVAISSNLAEGHSRSGCREFGHYVSIAQGFLCELETQFPIAEQFGYSNFESPRSLMNRFADIHHLNNDLLRSLQS